MKIRPGLVKLVIIYDFYLTTRGKLYVMLYIVFHDGWEPDLIQRILIGFEAILESILNLKG